MSILEDCTVENLHYKKPEKSRLAVVDFASHKTGDFEPLGLATKYKYLLKLQIFTEFWCNDAQYEYALENAKLSTVRHLFKNFYSISSRLRKAAYDDDYEEVFNIADEIDKEIGLTK